MSNTLQIKGRRYQKYPSSLKKVLFRKNTEKLSGFKNRYAVKIILFDELAGGIKFNLDSEGQVCLFAVEIPENFIHGFLEFAADVRVGITVVGNTGV